MKTKNIKSYLILHIGLFIYSLGFIFSKLSSNEDYLSFRFILFFGLQILTLGIYALIYQKALKNISLISAYANKGITIIWAMIIGYFLFKEPVSTNNLIGSLIIMAGIIVIALGEKADE